MSRITGNEDIIGAVLTAMQICDDETHGYTRGGNMDPDTDCSGLIWYALHENGFDVGSSRWDTSTMMQILREYGNFTEFRYVRDMELHHGDICVHRETGHGHALFIATEVTGYTALAYNYNQQTMENYPATRDFLQVAKVEAYGDRGHPADGDQANNMGAHTEVFIHAFDGLYSGYDWRVFRWNGGPQPPGQRIPSWMLFKIRDNNFEDERRTFI